jgi:hypothetical protein
MAPTGLVSNSVAVEVIGGPVIVDVIVSGFDSKVMIAWEVSMYLQRNA